MNNLQLNELQDINGGGAWSDLGQLVGGLSTGAVGAFGLGMALGGPGVAIVFGLYGAVAGGAAAGWDANH